MLIGENFALPLLAEETCERCNRSLQPRCTAAIRSGALSMPPERFIILL